MGRATFAAALAAAAIVGPARAEALVPGTYKLEWQISEVREQLYSPGVPVEIRQMSAAEAKKLSGLVSKKCLVGESKRFRIIIDESKGTGKGYDRAYLIPLSAEPPITDVRQATVMALKKHGTWLEAADGNKAIVDVLLGEKGSQIAQKASVDLRISVSTSRTGRVAGVAWLFLCGGWYGRIKTDAGEVPVRLVDTNSDGIFGGRVSDGDEGMPELADVVIVGEVPAEPSFATYPSIAHIGAALSYEGRLYELQPSKAGDTLEVKPYMGDAGLLKIEARDGYGNPAQCQVIVLFGDAGIYYLKGGQESALPVGKYECIGTAIAPMQGEAKQPKLGVDICPTKSITITKDRTTTLGIGGKVSMHIEPKTKPITVKRGQQLDVNFVFAVGSGAFRGFTEGDRGVMVKIKDPKGKTVAGGKAEFG